MAFAPWKPDLYQVHATSRLYESSSHRRHSRPACTRRMAQWLSDLPSPPPRRQQFLSESMSFMVNQDSKAPSNMDRQADSKRKHMNVPHLEHENPLRQHPIRWLSLPIRVQVPQRRSSLNFNSRDSRHSLDNAPLPDVQATSPQTETATLRLGLPKQTTTTGLHLNYGQSRASRRHFSLPQQTITTGLHLNYPRHATARPQYTVLSPRDATALQTFYSRLFDSSSHPVLNMSNEQNQRDIAQDPIVVDFGAQATSSQPPKPATEMHRQMSQMGQIRQLFGGTEVAKGAESRKRTRSEVSGQWKANKINKIPFLLTMGCIKIILDSRHDGVPSSSQTRSRRHHLRAPPPQPRHDACYC